MDPHSSVCLVPWQTLSHLPPPNDLSLPTTNTTQGTGWRAWSLLINSDHSSTTYAIDPCHQYTSEGGVYAIPSSNNSLWFSCNLREVEVLQLRKFIVGEREKKKTLFLVSEWYKWSDHARRRLGSDYGYSNLKGGCQKRLKGKYDLWCIWFDGTGSLLCYG